MKVLTQFNSTFNVNNNPKMQAAPLSEKAANMQVPLLQAPMVDTVSFSSRRQNSAITRDPNTPATDALNFLKSQYSTLSSSFGQRVLGGHSPSAEYALTIRDRQERVYGKASMEFFKRLMVAYDRDAQKEAIIASGIKFDEKMINNNVLARKKGWDKHFGKPIDDRIMTMLEENAQIYAINKAIEKVQERDDYKELYEEGLSKVLADKDAIGFYLTEGSYFRENNYEPIKDYHGWFREMMVWTPQDYFYTDDLDPVKDKEEIAEKATHKRIYEGIKATIIDNFDNPDPRAHKNFYLYRGFKGGGKNPEWDAYILADKCTYQGDGRVVKLDKKFLDEEYTRMFKDATTSQRHDLFAHKERTRFEFALKKIFIEYCGRPSDDRDEYVPGLPGNCILEPLRRYDADPVPGADPYDYLHDYDGKDFYADKGSTIKIGDAPRTGMQWEDFV